MGKDRMIRAFQIAAVCLILALVVGLYRAKTDASAARARVNDLRAEIADTRADIRELRAEIATLETPARVEALAKQKLSMSPAGGPETLPERALEQALPPPREAR